MFSLLGATYLAPVASLARPDFAVWLFGMTGQLKSELAALSQGHFGSFDRKSLAASWTSTAASLEGRTFTMKDAICVIDDYAPQADVRSQQELGAKAQQVIRGIGNLAARGRSRADLTARPDRPPRGIVICTGEDVPPGSSLVARLVILEVDRRLLHLDRITTLQGQVSRLPEAMRAYIEWLRPEMASFEPVLREAHREARARLQVGTAHLRQPEALAHLYVGIDLLLQFAVSVGAIDLEQADAHRNAAESALRTIGARQLEHLRQIDPADRFVRVIQILRAQGKIRFASRDEPLEAVERPGVRRDCEPLGWEDKEYLYLLPEAARRRVATFVRESGEAWPHSARATDQALLRHHYVVPDPDGRPQAQRRVGGRKQRVLMMPRAVVDGDEKGPVPVPTVPSPSPLFSETGDSPAKPVTDEKEEEESVLSPVSPVSRRYSQLLSSSRSSGSGDR
jgi:DNA polymerase-1